MQTPRTPRPALLYALLIGLLFQGLSGIIGGVGLLADPTGAALQIPIQWLEGSPFTDYLIPGLVLLLVLGVFPLIVVYGLWTRRYWAWPAALGVGVALVVWIGVEVLVIGYHTQPPLQLIYGSLGVVLLGIALLPPVRRYYAVR